MPLNTTTLVLKLQAAGIPVVSVYGDGRYDLAPDATDQQRTLAAQIVAAYDQKAEDAKGAALRQALITQAQSAVGVRVDQLSAAQQKAMVAILLWNAGGLNPDMTIAPLATFVRTGD